MRGTEVDARTVNVAVGERRMKSGSESVIRTRCRGKERSEKGADGGQRERKSVQGHFFNVAEAHLSIKTAAGV